LNFGTRLKVALGSAKGVLYLHTKADPPIFHRDIKDRANRPTCLASYFLLIVSHIYMFTTDLINEIIVTFWLG
jgi:hypothetical protein